MNSILRLPKFWRLSTGISLEESENEVINSLRVGFWMTTENYIFPKLKRS